MQLLSNGPNLRLYDVAYNWRQIQLWKHKNKKQILARESAKKKKKGVLWKVKHAAETQ